MGHYLKEEQLKSSLRLGKAVEQWLTFTKEQDYVILKWLRIDKEKNDSYTVAYFESFDEGNFDFLDIYEFSLLNPDEPFGVINTFNSVEDALIFSKSTYDASNEQYVTSGMIQEEYRNYLSKRE